MIKAVIKTNKRSIRQDAAKLALFIIETQIVSLKARLKRASGFIMNTDMQIECDLLRAQIEALEGHKKEVSSEK